MEPHVISDFTLPLDAYTSDDAGQLSFPIDAYRMTTEEDIMLQQAAWVLTLDCLAAFGVDYTPPPLQPEHLPSYKRRYGLLDLKSARGWGYHGRDPAVDLAIAEADAAEAAERDSGLVGELLFGPSDASVQLPSGVPEVVCLNEARRALMEGEEAYDEVSSATQQLGRASRAG